MSLSTLIEAAKYLDYLDSNPQQAQQQQQRNDVSANHQHRLKTQPTLAKRSSRRQRSSKKDAANAMVAMSLPASTDTFHMQHGVPIPSTSGAKILVDHHASLSSSFTESPLSSFASTALLCSKASEVTSASSSSTASSLSSSDSSSSCGEILMGDNDFNQSPSTTSTPTLQSAEKQKQRHTGGRKYASQRANNNLNLESSYLYSQSSANNQPTMIHKFNPGSYNDRGQSIARYIAATSNGPQLVTMATTSSGGITSASAPIDGRIRAGHVIHAATYNTTSPSGSNLDANQFSIGGLNGREGQPTFSMTSPLGSDNHLSSSPGSCAPLIMARVQPMILNSISPSTHHGLMAFQQTHPAASSPTSSSSSYSRHRELHKTLEKNRRAHLRHCFELLKSELPSSECADKKTSHINIIKSAIRYVLALRQQECEIDNELQRLTKIKNELTEKLSAMRNRSDQAEHDIVKISNELTSASTTGHSAAPTALQTTNNRGQEWPTTIDANQVKQEDSPQQNPPAAEHQLSYLLSQSKID